MYNDIIKLLKERRLKEAFELLNLSASDAGNWLVKSEVENLKTTYGYMLQYAAKGMQDPERDKMYSQLVCKAYELADRVEYIRTYTSGQGHRGELFRTFKRTPPPSYGELCLTLETIAEDMGVVPLMENDEDKRKEKMKALSVRREKTVDTLFDKTWVSDGWTEEEFNEATALLRSVLIPVNDIAVMISAVTMSLLDLFDPRKYQFLLTAYNERTETLLTQRALIGIVLATFHQKERLALYPEFIAALSLFMENPETLRQLHDIQILLLLSRETTKIDKKMREEIIPQMMKNPQFNNSNINVADLDDMEDMNPEWKAGIEKISERIREMGELQMEGADTYMTTFCQLKSYPFFNRMAHWFYPFDKQVPEVAALFDNENISDKSLINLLLESSTFCNSDKYSFCLTVNSIPLAQRQALSMQLDEQNEFMRQNLKEEKKANDASRQYIHDLYRFFKISLFRQEHDDIFANRMSLWENPFLRPLILTDEYRKPIADYLFAKDYVDEAALLYTELTRTGSEDAEVWQKLGFCLQTGKRYEEAIEAYKQADLFKPDHRWTLKHLAQCYKRMQNYEEALSYFLRIEQMQPEDLNLLMQIGQCLTAQCKYNEALNYFFKVEYLTNSPVNAQRAIGWCYFMEKKYDEAIHIYEKIHASSEVRPADYLNAGHACLLRNDLTKALDYYRHTQELCKSYDEFIETYHADKEIMLQHGITEEYFYLIPDLL